MAVINKSTSDEYWQRCGEKETLAHCWWECRLVLPLWKTVWSFLKKFENGTACVPAIPLLGMYPKKPNTLIQESICTPMFTAA